jgi:hypothetical protein
MDGNKKKAQSNEDEKKFQTIISSLTHIFTISHFFHTPSLIERVNSKSTVAGIAMKQKSPE